ncbi:MAG: YMGG-like glycine zipper-containing protein [Desulfobacteraceae bacterium]
MTWIKRVALVVLIGVFLAGCAGQNPYTYQGATVGGALGAGTGALIDDNNRWRGAMIGGLGGAALGGAVTEISRRAAEESMQRQSGQTAQPYHTDQYQSQY